MQRLLLPRTSMRCLRQIVNGGKLLMTQTSAFPLYRSISSTPALSAKLRKKTKKPKAKPRTKINIPTYASVANLATLVNVRYEVLLKRLEEMGFENMNHNYILDQETAGLIADEFGFEVNFGGQDTGEDLLPAKDDGDAKYVKVRPPIVTIMGHVDHGKTTILDYLRKSSIVSQEHGGITQHIGAFSVITPITKKQITFLDTPGHAAFLKMRERGATVTDIVVLVVAADDSVMPQTIEAIKHIKKTNVQVIVAVNKCDKENVNPDKVLRDLSRYEIYPEKFGGDVPCVEVSGLTGLNMEKLEETIVTLSEILDLKAQQRGAVEGWVIESESKKGMGALATVLVRRGTLTTGDVLVSGTTYAKVKSMKNEFGKAIKSAPPSTPVEIWGWKDVPFAGDEVLQAKNESHAKEVVETRLRREETQQHAQNIDVINKARIEEMKELERQEKLHEMKKYGLDEASLKELESEKPDEIIEVKYIVKADVSGSSEAIVESIKNIGNDEVKCSILYSGVGAPTETDLERAEISKSTILCFNMKIPKDTELKAENRGVKILKHNVIYHLIEDVTKEITSKLKPIIEMSVLAEVDIRQIFEIKGKKGKNSKIAGCKVKSGKLRRSSNIRILRNDEEIYRGKLETLKRVKDDVSEVLKGTECGLTFNGWDDFQEGDLIQVYEETEIPRYL